MIAIRPFNSEVNETEAPVLQAIIRAMDNVLSKLRVIQRSLPINEVLKPEHYSTPLLSTAEV